MNENDKQRINKRKHDFCLESNQQNCIKYNQKKKLRKIIKNNKKKQSGKNRGIKEK